MKKMVASLWFRLVFCLVLCLVFIVIPSFFVNYSHSNGLVAGVFSITMFCGLPLTSLLCGCLSAPDYKKLWFLPAIPSVVYFLLFPFLTDGYITYILLQFAGLIIGYAAFAICAYIISNRKR